MSNILKFMVGGAFCLLISNLVWAHRGQLDGNGGHLNELTGLYHFQSVDGIYEPNVEGTPANTLVGPWVYTVVPVEKGLSQNNAYIREDALDLYTEGNLTETILASKGVGPGIHKGHGWRLDWEVGFLDEENAVCDHNIPEIAGHLATYHGSSYFYSVLVFSADRAAKATIHLEYHATVRAWLNGVEFFHSNHQTWGFEEPNNPIPKLPQVQIREGKNLLVIKVGRGGNNCGNALEWMLTCGLKPHTKTRITVPFVYEDGEVAVDYFTESTSLHDLNGDGVINILDLVIIANAIQAPAVPSARQNRKSVLWAEIKKK